MEEAETKTNPGAPCCDARPRRYMGKEVGEIPELAVLLDRQGTAEWPREYRCRVCGQKWFTTLSPAMHADVSVVYKEGASPDPFRDEDGNTGQWAAPTKPLSRYPSTLADTAILVGAVVLGLATLPDAGYASRQTWFIGWMVAGFLALFVSDFWRRPQK